MISQTALLNTAHAVGSAVSHNPISLIMPCHRVVGTNESLTGYAGGIDRKVQLLTMEKAGMSGLFVPAKGSAVIFALPVEQLFLLYDVIDKPNCIR